MEAWKDMESLGSLNPCKYMILKNGFMTCPDNCEKCSDKELAWDMGQEEKA